MLISLPGSVDFSRSFVQHFPELASRSLFQNPGREDELEQTPEAPSLSHHIPPPVDGQLVLAREEDEEEDWDIRNTEYGSNPMLASCSEAVDVTGSLPGNKR